MLVLFAKPVSMCEQTLLDMHHAHNKLQTLLGEPLLNLRCATALGGACFTALAGFAPAALQTVRDGKNTAGRAASRCVVSATYAGLLKLCWPASALPGLRVQAQ